MIDFMVLGTDTSVGKTTFSLLWLALFGKHYEYWKPVETGDSDTEQIRRLLPDALVHDPVVRYRLPAAPPLAARAEQAIIPDADELATAKPKSDRSLLVETFGSPFSPLTETELQLALIQRIGNASVLVSSSSLGAIGRTVQCLQSLA